MERAVPLRNLGWIGRSERQVERHLFLLGLLGEEYGLDVRQYTTLSDGDSGKKFVEFLVVSDGELQVTGNDTGLLVVTSSVAGELKNLSSQVFHDSCKVNWGTSSYAVSIVSLPQETVDPAHWELKSGTGRPRLGLSLNFASFAASRHDE